MHLCIRIQMWSLQRTRLDIDLDDSNVLTENSIVFIQ